MKKILILSILLLIYCGSGGKPETEQQGKTATIVRSILMVIAPKGFHDEEFKEPYDLFKKSGINVVVASTDTTPARGMFGMIVKPDLNLESVNTKDYGGIVVVGGEGCKSLWNNATLHELVRAFNTEKKTVAAICMAPMILANAGILQDRVVTVRSARMRILR
jgi:protease I